ncbi:tpr repeat-containing protein : Tetratricopeptide TPR_1 repeat-containing protein OS=Isosphaera pallida (strain ATCC 43644 / DSM 9630 / IS1B) GN=Isop_0879 PE=4 SV=1: TPR_11: TPR_2: TPR_11: TPR_1: Glyco_transf_41 [Gemmataceae bacterium]|nr:tpr repeat-containing protein : Tetratricopeptide TPR_1 repeat-containing protein OS=Isosphaera pallida (strain ATCC 43644 / DSM 9630 / IS1B) GN=Isop_0879 PE=4 SV=1: TPR_11: TPR_2: TPR_11: TPR_1: Glyco_transf_41 [Gemmataceae bacterium]VTU01330.1 tpr repeat-containing protein : Tetratricopeptide TPR_1 repeat-containing protein OS=Isosphaera pallida (strain ATCC 43644 / DSM 9630 / IS1B) GN=Isop_0879 PE=4 SV=1: TPR_11: TPR_2: TPR_11: TPR_1: Glyco_transf_41 [Gemmataceae bacterium]
MTADELFPAAAAAHARGDRPAARELAERVLELFPDHADGHALLGLVLVQAGDKEAALGHWRRTAERRPGVAAHHSNLGELLRQLGRPAEAEVAHRAAAALAPRWAEAHFGLGNVLKDQGRIGEALAAYDAAVAADPRHARAQYNRANLLREQGRVAEAERGYRAALAADPTLTDAAVNLAAALGELHRWAEAEDCYRRARNVRPDGADLHAALAGAVLAQGRTADAARLLADAERLAPDPRAARFRRETVLPPIAASAATIAEEHERLIAVLDAARADPPRLDPAKLHHGGLEPPMALAYRGIDVRPLLEAYAALYALQIEPLELLPRTDGKPRVGVVVTHGHEGVYDRCLGRLVERIASRAKVHVTLVCSVAGANVLRHLRPAFPGDYLTLPTRVAEAARAVRDARFDVLHFWEVGTDATNYFLPFFRPAPVQSATWGWPVTTGNPRVDHYVSSELLEPPEADAHYAERLVQLASLPTCYERPPAPPAPATPALRRKAFGVDAGTPVYLCVQNVRKAHPDLDTLLALILDRDRRGRGVFVADEQPAVTNALLARLRGTLGPDVARVGVVCRQDRANYLRLVAAADVVLDTPHYGGGANTVADAVACGTPLVTRPGPFHRGRWAAAVLRLAGLNELVTDTAEGYAAAAVRIATDEPFRRDVAARLLAGGHDWFDDPQPAEELEAFWLRCKARRHA